MSRRTERPYQVDGTGRLAQHSEAPCSVPEINGPVVQREFTFLLRETCKRAPSETAGARVSNGPRALAGVSRGRSTEGNEPGNTGGPHNSGRAELGRQNTTIGGLVPGAMKPIGRALGSDHRGRERVAAVSVRDCQEPPDADPHVRWRGRREGQPSRRPDSAPVPESHSWNKKVSCALSATSARLTFFTLWRITFTEFSSEEPFADTVPVSAWSVEVMAPDAMFQTMISLRESPSRC